MLRRRLLQHLDLFDAIEYSYFYTSWLGGNRRAIRLASDRGLPLFASALLTHVFHRQGRKATPALIRF